MRRTDFDVILVLLLLLVVVLIYINYTSITGSQKKEPLLPQVGGTIITKLIQAAKQDPPQDIQAAKQDPPKDIQAAKQDPPQDIQAAKQDDPEITCTTYNNGFYDVKMSRCICDENYKGQFCNQTIVQAPGSEIEQKRKDAFDEIYDKNVWGGDNDTRSGPGSTVAWTALIRKFIISIVDQYNIQSFLDSPCGDYNWMKHVQFPGHVEYVGMDIVRKIILLLRKQYQTSNHKFLHRDMVKTPPYKPFDLIFSRDALQHLPISEVMHAISNWENSNSTYLITTFYTGNWVNNNIKPGEYTPINLLQPPYNFPAPIVNIVDKPENDNRTHFGSVKNMGLWKLPIQRTK